MIFVDTGAWYAEAVPGDPNHAKAKAFLRANEHPLVTTDYVIAETLTLLRVRGERTRAIRSGENLFGGTLARVEWATPDDVSKPWGVFRTYQDKDWSFTDCVSFAVMERLRILSAFAFDHLFRQFGTVSVVP